MSHHPHDLAFGEQLVLPFIKNLQTPGSPSASGLGQSGTGPTGPPLPSAPSSGTLDRAHRGQCTIVVGLSYPLDTQGIFSALRLDDSGEFIVTLSLTLVPEDYQFLVERLTGGGPPGSVGVKFVPTTPNLVPHTTAPST